MLWSAMLRGTAAGLLTTAGVEAGANVRSSKDTPVTASADGSPKSSVVVYADTKKKGLGTNQFRTDALVTITIRAETDAPNDDADDDALDDGNEAAEALFDTLCELVETTLLSAQGFTVKIACENGSATATPESMDGLFKGMVIRGPGAPPSKDFVAIKSVNSDTITLGQNYCGPTGTHSFNAGTFIGLFENGPDEVNFYFDDPQTEGARHVFSGAIEIKGHVTEVFEPARGPDLTGINLYVDSVNTFDPQSVYADKEPFDVNNPPPRTRGPDGRPEIAAQVDIPTE